MKDNERHKGKTISDEMRAKQKAAQKALADKRKAEGICVRCGKRKTDGKHTNCAICRAAKASKQREYNERNGRIPIQLRGEGYCSRCYKPTDGKLCAECYEYLVKQATYMRSRQDNSRHAWRKASSAAANIVKCSQANGEPPRIDFNTLGGKVTLEENKRHTEAI
jgi:ribosomal protein L37E